MSIKEIKNEYFDLKKEKYDRLVQQARFYTQQAIEAENAGDKSTADVLRMAARQQYGKADEIANLYPVTVGKQHPIGLKKKPRTKKTPGRSGRKLSVNEMMASVFQGVEKVIGKNLAMDTLQHSATPEECKQWIQTIKAMFTDSEGKLDKKGYCNALNIARGNMLFTASELEKAVEDARQSGNTAGVPGYEVLIKRNQINAGLLAKEIKAVGGTVKD